MPNSLDFYIQQLLQEVTIPPQEIIASIPSNYDQICQAAVIKDLLDELTHLKNLFASNLSEQKLKEAFKQLCINRDKQNNGSYLSFNAIPHGACNKLYWQIAKYLFKPQNLGEMLTIVMPSITQTLILDTEDQLETVLDHNAQSTISDKIRINLKKTSLQALSDYPPTINALTECVVGDNLIFPVSCIAKLPFNLYQQLHEHLEPYTQLKSKLFTHNDDLKKLRTDIALVKNEGATPKQMFNFLIRELNISRSEYTGTDFAASVGGIAAAVFRVYLENLPIDIQRELLALAANNHTLNDVFEHLAKGGCVGQAADMLTSIRDYPSNQASLAKQDPLTQAQVRHIKVSYGKKPINLPGFDLTRQLPSILRAAIIKNIKITSTYDYVDLILNIPHEEYGTLLEYAEITSRPKLSKGLAKTLTMFSDIQKKAFMQAIMKQMHKMGEKTQIRAFAKIMGDTEAVKQIEALLSPNERLLLVTKRGNLEAINELIRQGANINHVNKHGSSPLHLAIKKGYLHIVNALINQGADIYLSNIHEHTPLHLAVMKGRVDIFKALMDHTAVSSVNENLSALLHLAAIGGHLDIISDLKKRGFETNLGSADGDTPLIFAARQGKLDAVNALINMGAHIDQANDYGCTPLHCAAANGNLNIVETLINKGANIHLKDSLGYSPIHSAAEHGQLEIINLLIDHGLNINIQTNNGFTPLHFAAIIGRRDEVDALIDLGANIDMLTEDGYTALHLALERGHLDIVDALIRRDANVKQSNKDGDSPLHCAAKKGYLPVINALVNRGANINSLNKFKDTAINHAVQEGHLSIVHALLRRNALIHTPNIHGYSAVHYAAQQGHLEIIRVLIDHGAPINTETKGGQTPIHLAVLNENIDVVKVLLLNKVHVTDSIIHDTNNPKIRVLLKLADYIDKYHQRGNFISLGSLWKSMTSSNFFSRSMHDRDERLNFAEMLFLELLQNPNPNIENSASFKIDLTKTESITEDASLSSLFDEAKQVFRST